MWLVIVTKVSSEEKRPRRRIGHWKKHEEGKQGLGSVTRPKDAEWIKVSSTRGASASTSTWRLSLVMPNDSSSVWLTDCPCRLHCTLTFSLFLPFCRSLSILADIERGPDSGQTSPRSSYFPFYSYWSRPFESTSNVLRSVNFFEAWLRFVVVPWIFKFYCSYASRMRLFYTCWYRWKVSDGFECL